MAMPWYKQPTEDDFCLHAVGRLNENYYMALLRIKGRGQLDQPLRHTHIPQFHLKLTSWVAKLIGISQQRAKQLKELFLVHGLIDDYWQPLNWEQRYGPGASYRRGEAVADDLDDPKEEAKEKPQALTSTERSRKRRAKQKGCNDNATHCNDNATHSCNDNATHSCNEDATPCNEDATHSCNENATPCNENATHSCNEDATPCNVTCNDNATPCNDNATQVQRNSVASPVASKKIHLKINILQHATKIP